MIKWKRWLRSTITWCLGRLSQAWSCSYWSSVSSATTSSYSFHSWYRPCSNLPEMTIKSYNRQRLTTSFSPSHSFQLSCLEDSRCSSFNWSRREARQIRFTPWSVLVATCKCLSLALSLALMYLGLWHTLCIRFCFKTLKTRKVSGDLNLSSICLLVPSELFS